MNPQAQAWLDAAASRCGICRTFMPGEDCGGCKRDPNKLRDATMRVGLAATDYVLARSEVAQFAADQARAFDRLARKELERAVDDALGVYLKASTAQVTQYDAKGKREQRVERKASPPEPRPHTPLQSLAHNLVDQSVERASLGIEPPEEFAGNKHNHSLATLRMIATGEAKRIEAQKQAHRDEKASA